MNVIKKQHSPLTVILSVLLLLTLTTPLSAQFGSEPVYKHGAIYARDLVKSEQGNPYYVVFDPDTGAETAFIGEAAGFLSFTNAKVISADYYNAILSQYEEIKTDNPSYLLYSKDDFLNASFLNANEQPMSGAPTLKSDTIYVLVLGKQQRYTTDKSTLVQLELSINPNIKLSSDKITSLIIEKNGDIHSQVEGNIGFRTAFYGDGNEQSTGSRSNADKIYGPLKNVKVEIVGNKGADSTDDEGKYNIKVTLPPCPGFFYKFNTSAYAEINYLRFSPRGGHSHPYYMARYDSETCYTASSTTDFGTSLNGIMTSLATSTSSLVSYFSSNNNTDFPVDLMYLSGKGVIKNPDNTDIEVTTETVYNSENQTFVREAQLYNDLDGDGVDDISVLGNIVEVELNSNLVKQFKRIAADATPSATIQGVWLSSVNDAATLDSIKTLAVNTNTSLLPNLQRLPDWKADFEDRGLLSKISTNDFRQTDLYIFRESNGVLIAERKGLNVDDLDVGDNDGVGIQAAKYFYNMLILGNTEGIFNDFGYVKGNDDFTQWQQGMGILDPKLQQRKADHLRPGEKVRLIAINRVTGYMGTLRTELYAASATDKDKNSLGQISFAIEDIVMKPPNLKIWAKRYIDVKEGLSKGEKQEYQIANEGAGLVDDKQIIVFTEWFDHDGSPLPSSLTKDYAFTGRLAQVVDDFKLDTVTKGVEESANALSHFAIKPGRHIQVVRTPDKVANKQHFYVQVSAKPATGSAQFGSYDNHQGILQKRPKEYVPFLVPLFDENETSLIQQAYKLAKAASSNNNLSKPVPSYQWVYRPEYQFSVYDLTINKIINTDSASVETEITTDTNVIASSADEKLEVFYSLMSSEYTALEAYSYKESKELVFTFAGSEQIVTLNNTEDTNSVTFDNLDALDSLNPEEIITIRLYANNDTANVLWELRKPGIYAYYKVAASEHFARADEVKSTNTKPHFWTLGGMRLKLFYYPEQGQDVISLTWDIGNADDGRFVSDFKYQSPELPSPIVAEDVFWEPKDWQLGASDSEVNYEGTLRILYRNNEGDIQPIQEKTFTIGKRLLEPKTTPMKGTDVAMLENVLWHLGISPQKFAPGSQGGRIASNRSGNVGGDINTQTCDGSIADDRSKYYTGWWSNNCSTSSSNTNPVSLEGMVRRLQGRSEGKRRHRNGINGKMDQKTLDWLEDDWVEYQGAFSDYSDTPVIHTSNTNMNLWLNQVVNIWENGLDTKVSAAYTQIIHDKVLLAAGLSKGAKSRQDLLIAWKFQESPYHWGSNISKKDGSSYQATNFRMAEGGADNFGSLSFSQVLYKHRYSDKPCKVFKDTALNFYHPIDNLKAFAVYTSMNGTDKSETYGNCGNGPFKQAFVTKVLGINYETSLNDLIGYKQGDSEIKSLTKDDEYEIFSKGIGLYNGAGNTFTKLSWPNIIKTKNIPPVDDSDTNTNESISNKDNNCFSCQYSINIKNVRYGLSYRTYIWRGASDIDVNGDGEIKDIDADPSAVPPITAIKEKGWCFAFGEKEWKEGKSFISRKNIARGDALASPPVAPIGQVSCITGI